MKKARIIFGIAFGLLAVSIIIVIVLKFIVPINIGKGFNIREIEKIKVLDMKGNQVKLVDLFKKDEVTYCLIFELTNCYSCISQGIEDLKSLQKSGKSCIGLVVNNFFMDAAGWFSNNDFSPFAVIRKDDFYENIFSQILPVIVKIKNGEVQSYRYIIP